MNSNNIILIKKSTEEVCWTCNKKPATKSEYRDSLGENEMTCADCHREEYPEQYEEEECTVFKCIDCDNPAAINEYYPNGDYEGKYWTLCEECYRKDQEESDEEEDDEDDVDIVFKCSRCDVAIIRNSEEHDNCQSNEEGDVWWCMHCKRKEDDEDDEEDEEEEEEVKCGICEKKLEDTNKCDYNDDIGEYCCNEPNCLRKFWGDEEEEKK